MNEQKVPFSIRAAEKVTSAVGTWKFLIFQTIFLLLWAGLNVWGLLHLDPWPFIAMNLILSLQAAYTAPIILMAEKRHSDHDRLVNETDLKTDLQVRNEITEIKKSISRVERTLVQILQTARERKSKQE